MPETITSEDEKELVLEEIEDEKNVDDESEGEQKYETNFNITSYGADYTVDSLVKRVDTGAFFVPPFQRLYVWNLKQASKFIESLLLGLPVPGIFVYRESETQKHLIVDGQQRLKTLQFFYKGVFKDRSFRLTDVRDTWNGRTYEELNEPDRLRLDDSVLHATVFRQDFPEADNQSVYEVFERINSGGIKLSAQEIRSCVSYGKFTSLLRELNANTHWREIYGPRSVRLKDEELILRFLALLFNRGEYRRPLAKFLNKYLAAHEALSDELAVKFSWAFYNTIEFVHRALGGKPFRPERALNTAVFDAVMVGLAERLDNDPAPSVAGVKLAYDQLLADAEFQSAYRRSTADEEQVSKRIRLALAAFRDVS